jgi:hypothetical protein
MPLIIAYSGGIGKSLRLALGKKPENSLKHKRLKA